MKINFTRQTWDYLWYEWVKPIIIAAILALFIRTFIVQPFKIPSNSMYPTLKPGDRIFVNKFLFGVYLPFTNIQLPKLRAPQSGDIVVFTSPKEERKYLVKRFIAGGGDTVEIKEGQVLVNGKPMIEKPFTKFFYYNRGDFGAIGEVVKIPENHFFVLGDNSANSLDSRFWGFVPDRNLVGKAFIIHWPIRRIQLLRERD